jgi:integrase
MKGSLKERSPGRWAIIIDVGGTGKRRQKWHSFKGTKRQAQIECARLISEMQNGGYIAPNKITMSEYFEKWLTHVKPNVSARTHERYGQLLRKSLAPLIGDKLLSKLQPIDISEAYGTLVKSLSPRTVEHCHKALSIALNQAERWKLIPRNPAALLQKRDRPRIEKKPVSVIDAPTTATIFDAARESRVFIPIILGTLCGLRRGEITALRWSAVDLERGQLAVVASTEQCDNGSIREKDSKSGRSRTIAIPAMAVVELRRWQARQSEELLRLGVRVDNDTHVVTRPDGLPIKPKKLTEAVSAFLEPWDVTLHKLRHSHASHLLASNVHPKIVQERLGHSSISITLDIYSHLMPNTQDVAALAIDQMLAKREQ